MTATPPLPTGFPDSGRGPLVLGRGAASGGRGLRLPAGTYEATADIDLPDGCDAPALVVELVLLGTPERVVRRVPIDGDRLWRDGTRTRAVFLVEADPPDAESRYGLRLAGDGARLRELRLEAVAGAAPPGRSMLHRMTRGGPPAADGAETALVWGPYIQLPAGLHEVEFVVRLGAPADHDRPVLRFDTSVRAGSVPIAVCTAWAEDLLPAGDGAHSLRLRFPVRRDQTGDSFEFRVWHLGNGWAEMVDVRLCAVPPLPPVPRQRSLLPAARPGAAVRWVGDGLVLGRAGAPGSGIALDTLELGPGFHHLELVFETVGPFDAAAPLLHVHLACTCCGLPVIDRVLRLDDLWPDGMRSAALLPLPVPHGSPGRFLDLRVEPLGDATQILHRLTLHRHPAGAGEVGTGLPGFVPAGQRRLRRGPGGFRLHRRATPEFIPAIGPVPVEAGAHELLLDLDIARLGDAEQPLFGLAMRGAGWDVDAFALLVRLGDLDPDGRRFRLPLEIPTIFAVSGVEFTLWSEGHAVVTLRDARLMRLAPRQRLAADADPLYRRPILPLLVPAPGIAWSGGGHLVVRDLPEQDALTARFVNHHVGWARFELALDLWNLPAVERPVLKLSAGRPGEPPFLERTLGRSDFRRWRSMYRLRFDALVPNALSDSEVVVTLRHLGGADWMLRRLDWCRPRPPAAAAPLLADWLSDRAARLWQRVRRLRGRREDPAPAAFQSVTEVRES